MESSQSSNQKFEILKPPILLNGKSEILESYRASKGENSNAEWNSWSPQDDGIEVSLPSFTGKTLSRQDVDANIDSVIGGRSRTSRRLPVFAEICTGDGKSDLNYIVMQ